MFEKSRVKKDVIAALVDWDYNKSRANAFNIAKSINASESSVIKILRGLKETGLAESHRGSWTIL